MAHFFDVAKTYIHAHNNLIRGGSKRDTKSLPFYLLIKEEKFINLEDGTSSHLIGLLEGSGTCTLM